MRKIFPVLCCLLAPFSPIAEQLPGSFGKLAPFERAVAVVKHFEGWHTEKHYPTVGFGHVVQPGERFVRAKLTPKRAEDLLRWDLRKSCAMFRGFGRDSILLGVLAYNVGPWRILGNGSFPESRLAAKLRRGDRDIVGDYLSFCHKDGKFMKGLLRRRVAELALLFDRDGPTPMSKPQAYVAEYAPLAVEMQSLYDVPASVTLAQAIIESSSGTSRAAREANNHFGVMGRKGCRRYGSVEDSYRHHAEMLAQGRPYKALRGLSVTDYKGWCRGLQKAGYAKSKDYARILIRAIERYGLHRFDLLHGET